IIANKQKSEDIYYSVCRCTGNMRINLVCGTIGCGQHVNGHAKDIFNKTHHPYFMELQSQCV
ncbi:hypothetical protein IWW38_004404, partial [Coemansia aciculifera]